MTDATLELALPTKESSEVDIDKKYETAANQERQEKPKVSVEVFLAPHRTPKDVTRIQEQIKGADIYAPEVVGWTNEQLDILREVSAGRIEPEGALAKMGLDLQKDFTEYLTWQTELKQIYQTGKPIVFFDLPRNETALRTIHTQANIDFSRSFENIVNQARKHFAAIASEDKSREEYIAATFDSNLKQALKDFPALGSKGNLNVLLGLGYDHATLPLYLRKQGIDARGNYPVKPMIFPYRSQVALRLKLGHEVGDDLLARAAFEIVLGKALRSQLFKISGDTLKAEFVEQRITAELRTEEIGELFKEFASTGQEEFLSNLGSRLFTRGLKIPTNKEEVEVLLTGSLAVFASQSIPSELLNN